MPEGWCRATLDPVPCSAKQARGEEKIEYFQKYRAALRILNGVEKKGGESGVQRSDRTTRRLGEHNREITEGSVNGTATKRKRQFPESSGRVALRFDASELSQSNLRSCFSLASVVRSIVLHSGVLVLVALFNRESGRDRA